MVVKGKSKHAFESNVDELAFLLDSLETCIDDSRRAYADAVVKAASTATKISPVRGIVGRLLTRRRAEATTPVKDDGNGVDNSPRAVRRVLRQAKTIPIVPSADDLVEVLRRIAELVVMGENIVTNLQKQKDKEYQRSAEKWKSDRDLLGDIDTHDKMVLDPAEEHELLAQKTQEYMQLFDLFFERNALDIFVNMLTGAAFDLSYEEFPVEKKTSRSRERSGSSDEDMSVDDNASNDGLSTPKKPSRPIEEGILLPPLSVATQAIQSLAILVQNVSRATSLYVLLSNNHINKLINFPLGLYSAIERKRQMEASKATSFPSAFTSPELTELTTHFVTFLKSLAMRMNAETLQFFLKYPTEGLIIGDSLPASILRSDSDKMPSEGVPSEIELESPREKSDTAATPESPVLDVSQYYKVEFPLYERALEFCAAHQESFVRVTAMNICLNTLRLATVSHDDVESNDGESSEIGCSQRSSKSASPNGTLHDSKALPFRERFVIAQYTCTPSRVEQLISPIFSKLAERWNALDEQIREMDKFKGTESFASDFTKTDKVAKAKGKVRREKMIKSFKEKAADLQDELILLEDVFKVGLTVLNEQAVEMMLATFVYPLLLQPLLLYYQRYMVTVESTPQSFSNHPFGGYGGDYSECESKLAPIAAPAKTALFTLAAVFKLMSNRPLLRLIFTAVFHPLSPDSTSIPTVRSELEVATVEYSGRKRIRLDDDVQTEESELIPDMRTSYDFGTELKNRRLTKKHAVRVCEFDPDSEACVFVLAPALAEVLEFTGADVALITRARPNPYRQAILRCLHVPDEMSEIRHIAVGTMDAAFSRFESKFVADIVFGTDLKSYADDVPLDERNLDSSHAHLQDDRGIGGGAAIESRRSMACQKGGALGTDLTGEVINAICGSILFASKAAMEQWKLDYDKVACHALITLVREHPKAMVLASKAVENQWRQAATCLVEEPCSGLSLMGGCSIDFVGAPSVNSPDFETKIFCAMMNLIFYENSDSLNGEASIFHLMEIKDSALEGTDTGHYLGVSSESDIDTLCERVGWLVLPSDDDEDSFEKFVVNIRRMSARSFYSFDALFSLLREMVATSGRAFRQSNLKGLVFTRAGNLVEKEMEDAEMAKSIFSRISGSLEHVLFSIPIEVPSTGSVLHLVGSPAIPCVCEAPSSAASLFGGEASGVVAEGVTWHSLYLVLNGGSLIFVQPLTSNESGGDGRVISSCPLERIEVERDSAPVDGSASSARRLILSHVWFADKPPGLFLFDTLPVVESAGPFVRCRANKSRLDVWFEDLRASEHAFKIISSHIFAAKAERGQRMISFCSAEGR